MVEDITLWARKAFKKVENYASCILYYEFWQKQLANNRAQEFWAFSAPAPEPNFDPAGMTAPAPSPVHNFLSKIIPNSTCFHRFSNHFIHL